jgi:transposase
MAVNNKCANFKGENFYVGIDTHKSSWKITVRTRDLELKTYSADPSPEGLYSYMRRNYPNGIYHSVYEAGFCGYWIHRKLTESGFKNIIVNPSDVPSTNKERDRKSDPIDSRKLSRELANGSLRGIYIPSEEQESLRCVHRLYRQKSRRLTQIKNRLKGFLHFCGVEIPKEYAGNCWSNNFLNFLNGLQFTHKHNKDVLIDHVGEFKHARKGKLDTLKQIREIAKTIPIIKLLKSVPGIGPLTSFAIYVELVDIERFRNLDHLASYVGLVPSTQSSATTVIEKGICFRHNKYLRSALIESAWVAIRKDPALLDAYGHLKKHHLASSEAIIRIAKKLLNRIRFVWINNSEYVCGLVSVEKVKI